MKFDGWDFILLGVILIAVSTVLFVHVFQLYSHESTRTFLNGNPFQLRNEIILRWENYAGIIWLILGVLATIFGSVRVGLYDQVGYLFRTIQFAWPTNRVSVWFEITILLAAGLVAWRVTVATTDWLSRREYLPLMIEKQHELFGSESFVLTHEGLYQEDLEGGRNIEPYIREKRLTDASSNFDQIGKLIDLPRLKGEADLEYLKRLSHFFEHDD